MSAEPSKKNILGVDVVDASKEEVLQYITRSLENNTHPYYIVTPNPEIIVSAKQNPSFRLILNQARIALPDGVGITIAASFLGKKLMERISGTDFMELICEEIAASNLPAGKTGAAHAGKPITVGFLGGKDGVAEKTVECLTKRYPGLRITFVGEEWGEGGFDLATERFSQINKQINADQRKSVINPRQSIDILFVAFGFPKQEEWMAEHVGKIPVSIMMGVGGAFDYLSGNVPRAPRFLRVIGLEWLYRLIRQPWRWQRQLALLSFVSLIIKERIKMSH